MAETTSVAGFRPQVCLHVPARREAGAFMLVVFFATVPVAYHLVTPLVSQDEAVLMVHAEQVLNGFVPHRDFFSPYGPAATVGVAAAFKVLGSQYLAERVLGLLYHVLLATGLQRATRSWGVGPSCLAGSLCGLFLLPLQSVAFAWLGGLACLAWGVALMYRSSQGWVTAGAALAALASAWRPELLVPAVAITLLLAFGRATTPAALGLAIGTLPVLAHGLLAGQSFIDNVFLGRLGLNAQHDLGDIPTFVWAAAALVLLETLSLLRTALASRDRLDAALAALCLLILPQAVQRLDMEHVFYTLCVAAPLAVAQQLRHHPLWANSRSKATRRVRFLAAPAITLSIGFAVHSAYALHKGTEHMVGDGHRAIPVTDANEAKALAGLLVEVRTAAQPGTSIFIGTQDMSVPSLPDLRIYHLLPDFVPQGYYLDLPPGLAERRGSGLVNDIRNAGVLVLLATPPRGTPGYVTHAGRGAADANAAAERFCTTFENPVAEVRRPCRS